MLGFYRMPDFSIENIKVQMRKGFLEFPVLLVIQRGDVYASDILQALKQADLIVVEGTLYPLLSRMKRQGLVAYEWRESKAGPPRKYYSLTDAGTAMLAELIATWTQLSGALHALMHHEKSI